MEVQNLPLSKIRPGKNPRTHFDPSEMQELITSIEANTLLQPIVVRAIDDGYEIIAGERRFRAFMSLYGESGSIPAIVKECSDEQAEVFSLIENLSRAEMGPSAEAEACQRLLNRIRDKAEVAAQLGWPQSKLERRLALMLCAAEVRQMLNERKIMLGHAELLATLAEDKQKMALAKVIECNLTVLDLKKSLANLAQKLEEAIFDKADCLACQHNSTTQSALFAENIGDGSCTHPTCFQDKTNTHLHAAKEQLARVVNRVEFLEPGDEKIIPIKLIADGVKGVGVAQKEACKGCASFGATISKLPNELGKKELEICFDPACHAGKVADNLKALAASAAPENGKSNTATGTSTKASSAAAGVSVAKATVKEVRGAIKEYAEKVLRRVAAGEVAQNPAFAQTVLLWIFLTGNGRSILSTKISDAFGKATQGAAPSTSITLETVQSELSKQEGIGTRLLAASAGYTMMEATFTLSSVKQVLAMLNVDLSTKWKVNKEFLELLTKSEMEDFLVKTGLKESIGEAEFKKLLNNKKDDVIAGILTHVDGHLAGKLHESISYR